MRTLIVSDVHANIEALNAVFAAAEEEEPVDNVLCLGDIVDYGPSPMECLEKLWERNAVSIMGNHDAAAVGISQKSLTSNLALCLGTELTIAISVTRGIFLLVCVRPLKMSLNSIAVQL